MIVEKAVNMADMMKKKVVGLVENMSFYRCPDCGKEHDLFGPSRVEEIARRHGIANTARLPLDPALAAACDGGNIELFQGGWLDGLADALTALEPV